MGSTLEITIQQRDEKGWTVVAERQRMGQFLRVRSEGQLVMSGEPATTRPQSYGEGLGRALFTGSIRDAYVAARGDPPVRVWLCVEDKDLRTWRWEWLCAPVDGSRWDFLSLHQGALYSLYLPSLTDRPYPPIGRHDLRALVVVANPADPSGRYRLAAFDSTKPVSQLKGIFGGRITCDVVGRVEGAVAPATLDAIVTQLTCGGADGAYSILHIVCHGRFDGESNETWVYLEQSTADQSGVVLAQPVSASELIERLARVRQLPHLVFLSVCESSAPEAEQRLGGLAQRLVRELGIPAVIGMTEPVTVPTAYALAEAFYRRLLEQNESGAVDRALVEAYAGLASRLDVHVPALYSRLGAQPLFSLAVDRELTGGEIRAGLNRLEALLAERAPVLRPQLAKHRQALEPWLATDPAALSPDARRTREESLKAINEICQEAIDISFHGLVAGEQVPAYDARQPFRGLSPFRLEDREFFFGRDALIETLTRKLAEDRFLPVLGPSGSGKSSAVLAGLVPRLQQQDSKLQVAYLTPGSTPLEQLRAAQATLGDGPVVYVVDQFEEVFTACRDESQRRAFIAAVLELTRTERVVLTMRADFWGECAPYSALKARMQARQELIAPMTLAELRKAMKEQAAKVGLRFEADLGQTMLDEVVGEPGAMPLLQHALLELWKRRHGRWLRAAEYRTIGGVKRAIAETADRLYAELPPAEQERMRDIFLRLTQLDEQVAPGEERRDTRRRVSFDDLVPAQSDPVTTKDLIKRLADAVLVVTSHNPVTNQDEVEVAHEALIRHWTRLSAWVDEDLGRLRVRQRVQSALSEWESHDRTAEWLLRGGMLVEASRWLNDRDLTFTPRETAFIRASCEQFDAERLRLKKAYDRALARHLISQAELIRTHQPALLECAVLLATEALRREPTTDAAAALRLALDLLPCSETRIDFGSAAKHLVCSHDGRYLAVIAEDRFIVYDVFSATPVPVLQNVGQGIAAAFDSASSTFTMHLTNAVRSWRLADGKLVAEILPPAKVDSRTVTLRSDGELVAWQSGHVVEVWRIPSSALHCRFQQPERISSRYGMRFVGGEHLVTVSDPYRPIFLGQSSGGRWIESYVGLDGKLHELVDGGQRCFRIWKVTEDCSLVSEHGYEGSFLELVDEYESTRFFVVFSHRGVQARAINAMTGRELWRSPTECKKAAAGTVCSLVDVAAPGVLGVPLGEMSALLLIDAESGRELSRTLPLRRPRVLGMSNDGYYAVTYSDGLVQVWHGKTAREVARVASDRVFSCDSGRVFTTAADKGIIRRWRVAEGGSGRPIHTTILPKPLKFSDTGDVLFGANGPHLHAWDVANGRFLYSVAANGMIARLAGGGRYIAALTEPSFQMSAAGSREVGRSSVCVHEVHTGKRVVDFHKSQKLKGLAATACRNILAIGGDDGSVWIYDVDRHLDDGPAFIHPTQVTDVILSSRGTYVAAIGKGLSTDSINARDDLSIWNLERGDILYRRDHGVRRIVFSDDERLIIVISDLVEVLDPEGAEPVATFRVSMNTYSAAFGPPGHIWTCGQRSLLLWSLDKMDRPVWACEYDHDVWIMQQMRGSSRIALRSPHRVHILDALRREEVAVVGCQRSIHAALVSPDGSWLALATTDGRFRFEALNDRDLIQIATNRVGRQLSRAEWTRYLPDEPFPEQDST